MAAMNVVFVVDTSPSMAQRFSHGLSILDCAKSGIEHFLRVRKRDSARRDRYYLYTLDEPPYCTKFTSRPVASTVPLLEELKVLTATDVSAPSAALQHIFDTFNLQRQAVSMDNYGRGRMPLFTKPTIFILFSDGGCSTSAISLGRTRGDRTQDALRWDYRLVNIVLTSTADPASAEHPFAQGPLADLASHSGGRTLVVHSLSRLLATIESITGQNTRIPVVTLSHLSSGVLVRLVKQDDENEWRPSILRLRNPGVRQRWPLPENYWPDGVPGGDLPQRSAVPRLHYIPEDLPVPDIHPRLEADVYIVTGGPQHILAALTGRPVCWHVFVNGSGRAPGLGAPFGFLTASSGALLFYALPYNFPLLMTLFVSGAASTVPEHVDAYLRDVPRYYRPMLAELLNVRDRSDYVQPMSHEAATAVRRQRTAATSSIEHYETPHRRAGALPPVSAQPPSATGTAPHLAPSQQPRRAPLNIFDVDRAQLLAHVQILRLAVSAPRAADLFAGATNSVSIAKMSDPFVTMASNEPLRDATEDPYDARKQRALFGNPFKAHKAPSSLVDEGEAMSTHEARPSLNKTDAKEAPANIDAPSSFHDVIDEENAQSTMVIVDDSVLVEELPTVVASAVEVPARRVRAWMEGQLELAGGRREGSEAARDVRDRLLKRIRSTRKDYAEMVAQVAALQGGDAQWVAAQVAAEALRFRKSALAERLRPLVDSQ